MLWSIKVGFTPSAFISSFGFIIIQIALSFLVDETHQGHFSRAIIVGHLILEQSPGITVGGNLGIVTFISSNSDLPF